MDPDKQKEMVRRGYDAVSRAYRGDEESEAERQYHDWLDELIPRLEPGAPVLDLGCGNGIPAARRLARTQAVTGVDLSPVQVERARRLVPGAEFLCQDMSALDFPPAHFAAVTAFYSIIHVPLAEQPALLARIAGWLRPGGLFMATVGSEAWTGQEENWLEAGAPMAWSHADAGTYRRWIAEAGMRVEWTRFIPEGSGGHVLVMAVKNQAGPADQAKNPPIEG